MDEKRVTLDGREYAWNGQTWRDAETYIRPSSVLIRRLDSMAGIRPSGDDDATETTDDVHPRKRSVHDPRSGEFLIRLRVSRRSALDVLARNPNAKFQGAIRDHWMVDPPGTVDDDDAHGVVDGTSVCWLFCWAKAEEPQNEAASEDARWAFDEILDVSFAQFNKVVSHTWAQKGRYGNRAAVDAELNGLLGGRPRP